jgi:hypothetical protein
MITYDVFLIGSLIIGLFFLAYIANVIFWGVMGYDHY